MACDGLREPPLVGSRMLSKFDNRQEMGKVMEVEVEVKENSKEKDTMDEIWNACGTKASK